MVVSILPRLDEYRIREKAYAKVMEEGCRNHKVHFFNVQPNFQTWDRRLWSFRDGLHISEDKGIPLLLSLLRKEVALLLSGEVDLVTPVTPPVPARKCPEWLWRELRHHHPQGKYGNIASSCFFTPASPD